jgi:predicted nucleic acid-binding protein
VTLIVSDNSPLSALVCIKRTDFLPLLFDQVIVPSAVAREMSHPFAPTEVRGFIEQQAVWLSIRDPVSIMRIPKLDPGELAAISLALELRAPLLIDERAGRKAANDRGIEVIGVIGLLERAADLGYIHDLEEAHRELLTHGFHINESILAASLARHLANRLG